MHAPGVAPIACPNLCLMLEFDLRPVDDVERLPLKDHGAAAAQASQESGLMPAGTVAARGRTVAEANVRSVRNEAFDEWYTSEDNKVLLDFCYELSDTPKLAVRIVTDLRHCDGVTAVRLALHTLEVIEASGSFQVQAKAFAKNPPFPRKPHHRLQNLCCLILSIILDLVAAPWRALYKVLSGKKLQPNCPEGWMWYYRSRDYDAGQIHLFTPEAGKYKSFQSRVDEWRRQIGLDRGFFYLLNYSPGVSSGIVQTLPQLNSTEAKLRCALAEPAAPGTGPVLHMMNMIMMRACMFNNYGRHEHKFKAQPTAFCWDWLNFPGTMSAAFAISINGVFMCGLRGVADFVDQGQKLLSADGFGDGRRISQITHHPAQGWTGSREPVL